MALRESTGSASQRPISRFGTESGGTVPIRENLPLGIVLLSRGHCI